MLENCIGFGTITGTITTFYDETSHTVLILSEYAGTCVHYNTRRATIYYIHTQK